ncbi:Tudor domain-containing 7 [Gossypium arboreum]|uniref:Tudor domain-containing 7 n=1 Tax=Gossypium arboreum TaxID=29729 RepID=A0A0B0MXV2_GOSAR|nr:Tudor domain-containing 7 [Gossypium arboreum]
MCPLGYPTIESQARARPRHMGVSCSRVRKLVCMPCFVTA